MANKLLWKKLVTRESTLFERILRFEGYKEMLPEPFSVKQKDLLAIYENKMTTQYIVTDDFPSKVKNIKKDLEKIGFEDIVSRLNEILERLIKRKDKLKDLQSPESWKDFEKYYKLSRAIILYTFGLATFFKQSEGNDEKIETLQKIYDDAESKSSSSWEDLTDYFEKVSKSNEIPLNSLLLYTPEEFSKLIFLGEKKDKESLDGRESLAIMKLENYNSEVLFGKSARKKLEELSIEEKTVQESEVEIKGTVANKGMARGKARIVLNKKDYSKVNEGDILVTFMTHPDMGPMLSKISGIITDEGGVLCHAAIISRELKIPCIIGTKNATRVLKDGDLVEVDADRGTVKILKE